VPALVIRLLGRPEIERDGVTWCVIDEVKSGDWAIAGQALTTEAVHVLASGQPA
jgi:phenylpyruvate tautomerase PptA (4-oxalocrotonate tautomerase family)